MAAENLVTALCRRSSHEVCKISLTGQRFPDCDPAYWYVLINPQIAGLSEQEDALARALHHYEQAEAAWQGYATKAAMPTVAEIRILVRLGNRFTAAVQSLEHDQSAQAVAAYHAAVTELAIHQADIGEASVKRVQDAQQRLGVGQASHAAELAYHQARQVRDQWVSVRPIEGMHELPARVPGVAKIADPVRNVLHPATAEDCERFAHCEAADEARQDAEQACELLTSHPVFARVFGALCAVAGLDPAQVQAQIGAMNATDLPA